MATNYYSVELIKKVQDLIDDSGKDLIGIDTAWEQILKIFEANDIVYYADIGFDKVLCHPDNKGKQGLNGIDAHKKGASIANIGFNIKKMGEATAFEICPLEPLRKLQIDFNDTQVIASNGLLAKKSGSERLISVGCGHTAAFIKAAMAGCRTDQLAIQKADGTIDCDYLCKKGFANR